MQQSIDIARCKRRNDDISEIQNNHNENVKSQQLEISVTRIILELGVPANIKGYYYLKEAIIFKVNYNDIHCPLAAMLYPAIAKMYNTSTVRVERSITHAIEAAWTRGDPAPRHKFFRTTVADSVWRPANGEFIATVADYIKLKTYGEQLIV